MTAGTNGRTGARTERQAAVVDLLDRPAIRIDEDPVSFRRARLHLNELRQWFDRRCRWPLLATREVIRLVKIPARTRVGFGFPDFQRPLDYELFTWVLWYAAGSHSEQFLLSELVSEIEARANAVFGERHVDFDDYAHRQSMVRALRAHERLGSLRRVDGDPTSWMNRREGGNGLYEFGPLAYRWLVSLNGDGIRRLLARGDPAAEIEVEEGLPPRVRLYRQLLLAPAAFRADDPEAFGLLLDRHERRRIADELYDMTGWELEMTGAYAALTRPAGSASRHGELFPARRARTDLALLICTAIRDGLAGRPDAAASGPSLGDLPGGWETDDGGCVIVSEAQFERLVVALSDRYRAYWGASFANRSTEAVLREALDEMRAWDLLRGPDAEGRYRILPLASRFRGYYPPEQAGDREHTTESPEEQPTGGNQP